MSFKGYFREKAVFCGPNRRWRLSNATKHRELVERQRKQLDLLANRILEAGDRKDWPRQRLAQRLARLRVIGYINCCSDPWLYYYLATMCYERLRWKLYWMRKYIIRRPLDSGAKALYLGMKAKAGTITSVQIREVKSCCSRLSGAKKLPATMTVLDAGAWAHAGLDLADYLDDCSYREYCFRLCNYLNRFFPKE